MSPTKQPNGILLTPGTGTARRKRVSFNHDVKAGSSVDSSPLASVRTRKRTTLQKRLENSKKPSEKVAEVPSNPVDNESEAEWEDDVCNHDVTVDLNEPHSESGKYWKAEFTRYREEAMADIERMVKFKALAKSYAKKKDVEALNLSQSLKEEQAKVAKMEEKIAAMATQVAGKKRRGNEKEDPFLAKELSEQTNLAEHYRDQVKELETILRDYKDKSSYRYQMLTSPRTEKTIHEVNRELRRARSELKEMDKLRQENKELKSDLSMAGQRMIETREENRDKAAAKTLEIERLKVQLKEAKDSIRQKDHDIRKLKRDYESLKKDAKARTSEAMQVLQEKNTVIAGLQKTIKDLEAANPSNKATRDLKANIDSLGKPSKYESAQPVRQIRRSASVEDLSLETTQKSLLLNKDETDPEFKFDASTAIQPSHWSSSFKDIRSQLQKEKDKQFEADKLKMESILENPDEDPSRSPRKQRADLQSFDSGRAMSQVFASQLNKQRPMESDYDISTPRLPSKQRLDLKPVRTTANRSQTQSALEKLASRAERPRSYPSRPLSSGTDAPGYDLMQDRFDRLGNPRPERERERERENSANSSRHNSSTDRQAALQARLEQKREQKRLERQMRGGIRRMRDKENMRPA